MTPILYSFIRCPYAIRARMACVRQQFSVELREVNLKKKPSALLSTSPKGTVPVLVMPNGDIIDESADIVSMLFENPTLTDEQETLLKALHDDFIPAVRRYKYPDRYPDDNTQQTIGSLRDFLEHAQSYLCHQPISQQWTYIDVMMLPMIRQCYIVNKDTFSQWQLPHLQRWLDNILESKAFSEVMQKLPVWDS